MTICIRCKATHLGGQPMHQMVTSYDNSPERIEHWCIECIEEYSSACWDWEQGPYPFTVSTHLSGHA